MDKLISSSNELSAVHANGPFRILSSGVPPMGFDFVGIEHAEYLPAIIARSVEVTLEPIDFYFQPEE